MQNKIDYIFVDLDGTLLEGKWRQYHCYKNIILKDGGEPIDIDQYWEMKRNKVKREEILEKSNYQSICDDFYKQWMENIEKKEYLIFDRLKPDVKQVLFHWKNFSHHIVLITARNHHENLIWQLKELKIFDLFDDVISCTSFGKDAKYEAIKHIQFNRAVFVGDTEEDMKTAKLLGIQFIGITNGLRKKEDLEANYYAEEIKDIEIKNIINMI